MTPFVGRVDELAALTRILEIGERGRSAAAVVVGDPGSGKSRILAETAARAALPSQFRIVGYEPESEVPFASAADFLQALAGATQQGRRLEALVFALEKDAAPLDPIRVFEAAHRALS